jgi:hypothetical protein
LAPSPRSSPQSRCHLQQKTQTNQKQDKENNVLLAFGGQHGFDETLQLLNLFCNDALVSRGNAIGRLFENKKQINKINLIFLVFFFLFALSSFGRLSSVVFTCATSSSSCSAPTSLTARSDKMLSRKRGMNELAKESQKKLKRLLDSHLCTTAPSRTIWSKMETYLKQKHKNNQKSSFSSLL